MTKSVSKKKNLKGKFPRIGVWATVWWAVSGLYLVLVVWLGRDYFAQNTQVSPSPGALLDAVGYAYDNNSWLVALGILITAIWVVGGWMWVRALKKSGVGVRAGLKDLFGTLR